MGGQRAVRIEWSMCVPHQVSLGAVEVDWDGDSEEEDSEKGEERSKS